MSKLIAALSASAATLILTVAPAFAAQTSSIGSFMIADIGRDTVSLAKSNETLPTIVTVVPVDFPQLQRDLGYSTMAIIKVELTATGKLVSASVSKSTGNRTLDQNALYAVSNSKFAPGSIAGSPVGGAYAVSVDFSGQN
jgi:TonB family protein